MYHGNLPSQNFVSLKRQDITGDGTASYTLDYSVSSINDILVYVNHVKQDPASMTLSGTSLTMGGNVASTDDFYVIYLGQGLQTVTPADNTITTAMVQDDAISTAKIADNAITDAKINASLGKILQVQSTLKQDAFSSAAGSETDVTGLSVNITPSSTSSKILIMAHISLGSGQTSGIHMRVKRGTTVVGAGSHASKTSMGFASDGGGSDTNRALTVGAYHFIDEPSSTSQQTYKVTIIDFNGSNTVSVNTNSSQGGQAYDDIFTSGITAMEIAG